MKVDGKCPNCPSIVAVYLECFMDLAIRKISGRDTYFNNFETKTYTRLRRSSTTQFCILLPAVTKSQKVAFYHS